MSEIYSSEQERWDAIEKSRQQFSEGLNLPEEPPATAPAREGGVSLPSGSLYTHEEWDALQYSRALHEGMFTPLTDVEALSVGMITPDRFLEREEERRATEDSMPLEQAISILRFKSDSVWLEMSRTIEGIYADFADKAEEVTNGNPNLYQRSLGVKRVIKELSDLFNQAAERIRTATSEEKIGIPPEIQAAVLKSRRGAEEKE